MQAAEENKPQGSAAKSLPLWLKIGYALFVGVLVPTYWYHYGFADSFLWISSLALLVTLVAVWLESPLLASMQLVSAFLLELMWIFDYVVRLITGVQLVGIAGYMFDPEKSLFARGLSLFHAVIPFLLLWLVYRLGYDRRAWIVQTVFAWLLLPFCFWFTDPEKNINWVRGPGQEPQKLVAPGVYLAAQMVFLPLCIYLPTHLALRAWMPAPAETRPSSKRKDAS
jgi:hypothetical protein